ncbi:MAG: spore coat U domain-containing protein [Caulobacterales bacterium]
MKWRLALLATFAMVSLGSPAGAVCVCTCTVGPSTMPFGAFRPLDNAKLDIDGTVRVNCSGISLLNSFVMKLGPGLYGSIGSRQMRDSGNSLNYNLYSDVNRSIVWGDGTGGYNGVTVNNALALLSWTINVPIYGRIPPAPLTKPGTDYKDSVLVTVEY